jgi:hypothetical protein
MIVDEHDKHAILEWGLGSKTHLSLSAAQDATPTLEDRGFYTPDEQGKRQWLHSSRDDACAGWHRSVVCFDLDHE